MRTFDFDFSSFFCYFAVGFRYVQTSGCQVNRSVCTPNSEETLETPAGGKADEAERSIVNIQRNRRQRTDTDVRSFAE